MTSKRSSILLVGVLFLLSTLACSGRLFPDRTTTDNATDSQAVPARTVAVSQEAAQEAQQAISEAAAGGTLRMTEAQFTSLIVTQMAQGSGEVPLTDIVVWFNPGEIALQGQLQQGVVPLLSGELTMKGTLAAENGTVVFDITEATIAGISLPGAAINAFDQQINDALSQTNLGGRVRNITINEGEIVIEQE